ncbi:MAG: ABC transporter substrate-binding protein, partial [Stellaceae bacterium]
MTTKLDRRAFMAGTAAIAGAAALPIPAIAQQKPIKIGLMTVKTGGLAAGGIHLEEGITCFLKDKNFTLAGRKVELIVADTAGQPAVAKTKAVEMVERDQVDLIMGPLAAFEWLAIEDYLGQHKMPTMGFGGAEDLTQRHRNFYQVRTSDSSAQCLYPLADYAITAMKLKRTITLGDDFAFGYEQVGGFQKVYEDGGGRLVKKLWSPFNTPDYTPYLAQIDPSTVDVVVQVYAGVNPIKFTRQYRDQGFKLPLLGGSTVADDSIMRNFGDEAIGLIDSIPYTLDLKTEANRRFIAAMKKYYGADIPIGFYAAALYVNGQILEAALNKTGGKVDD